MLKIKSDLKPYSINIPTDISEITEEYFNKLLNNVKLPDNYVMVALCYNDRLFNCVNAIIKEKANETTSIVPLLAHKADNIKNFNIGDILIVDGFAVSRGVHFSHPKNYISYGSIKKYCSDDDKLYNAIIKGKFNDNKTTFPNCWFVEFKIIPVCDIKGSYSKDANFECIFKVVDGDLS